MTHPIHLSHLFEGFSEQRNKWGRSSAKAVGALLHGRLLGLHVGPLKRARAIARHLAAISLRKPWSSLSQVKLQQAVQWNRDILPPPLCPLLPLPITESNPQGTLPSKLIIQSKMFLKQIHLPFKVHICLQIPKKKMYSYNQLLCFATSKGKYLPNTYLLPQLWSLKHCLHFFTKLCTKPACLVSAFVFFTLPEVTNNYIIQS